MVGFRTYYRRPIRPNHHHRAPLDRALGGQESPILADSAGLEAVYWGAWMKSPLFPHRPPGRGLTRPWGSMSIRGLHKGASGYSLGVETLPPTIPNISSGHREQLPCCNGHFSRVWLPLEVVQHSRFKGRHSFPETNTARLN